MKNRIQDKNIQDALGLESVNMLGSHRTANFDPTKWGVATENAMISILNSAKLSYNSGGIGAAGTEKIGKNNLKHQSIENIVKGIVSTESRFLALPAEVKKTLEVPAKAYFNFAKKLAATEDADARFKLEVPTKLAKDAFERGAFALFASFEELSSSKRFMSNMSPYNRAATVIDANSMKSMEGFATESVPEYSDKIFIPKASTIVSWMNVASCIFRKVQPCKTVLNEICQIPTTTEVQEIEVIDKDGKTTEVFKRQDLYRYMDMSKVSKEIDGLQQITVKLDKSELNQDINLTTTPIKSLGNQPVHTNKENVGPQVRIVSWATTNSTEGQDPVVHGEIFDTRAGLAKGPAWGEADIKGKIIHVAAPEGEGQYTISMDRDIQAKTIWLGVIKSNPALPDVENITLEFKLRDLQQSMKSNVNFRLREEKTYLNSPYVFRNAITLVPEEAERLAERGEGAYLQKQIALLNEHVQNKKESFWIKEYFKMHNANKEMAETSANQTLYAEQLVDLNVAATINKVESMEYYLSTSVSAMKNAYQIKANTKYDVQLSFFGGTASLPAIRQCVETITGEVNESSDGNFLGIAQGDRINAITFGSSKSAPVQAIIVTTDKDDFAPVSKTDEGVRIATKDITHGFYALPTYKDENIKTTIMVETPSLVTTGNQIRANENPWLPAMIDHEGWNYNTLRMASGYFGIKGHAVRLTAD